jgi:5-hydroxyisourate hydrolase
MAAPTISTHVLDVERGVPVRGVRVELYREGRQVAAKTTDDDGRISDLLGGPLDAGTYRLVFTVPLGFFSRVEVEFTITDPRRHHHIPLVVAPYLCASYRGS